MMQLRLGSYVHTSKVNAQGAEHGLQCIKPGLCSCISHDTCVAMCALVTDKTEYCDQGYDWSSHFVSTDSDQLPYNLLVYLCSKASFFALHP